LLFVSRVDLNKLSSTVCPVAVSFPVPGHRTNIRLMIRAFGSFRGVLIIKYEFINLILAESIHDTRFFDVVGRHLQFDAIAGRQTDEAFTHFSGNVCEHEVFVCKRNTKHCAWKHGSDRSFDLNRFFSIHNYSIGRPAPR